MDVEDVLLGIVYTLSRVMGLVKLFTLQCTASNLVLEILKHDKIGGGAICISTPNSEGLVPLSPVIYAHAVLFYCGDVSNIMNGPYRNVITDAREVTKVV